MKKQLLFVFAAFATLVASAHDFKVDGIYYNITSYSDLTVEVTYQGDSYDAYSNEYSGAVAIPSTVTYNNKTYSVTSIGKLAFYGCRSLTTITIPEGVTSIGNNAFYGCSSLTTITVAEGNAVYDSRGGCNAIIETNSNTLIVGCSATIIPESVTSIGGLAFEGCSSLTAINIPESVTSIGQYAFSYCSSLTAITIPESVTSIGEEAFSGCRSLTTITIPENSQLTSIGEWAFSNCASLISITIPEGVTSIGEWAFSNCTSLTAITIPEGVTSIGNNAFYGCSSLTTITVAEGNAVYDSRGGCNAIIETNSNTLIVGCSATIIPESVTSIGSYAFRNCSSLTAINIPEGVTSIGDWAFRECSSLTSVTIPEGVRSIGNGAFCDCSSLTAITCNAITPPTVASLTFYGVDKSIPVYVPAGSVEAYKSASYWSEFTNIVASSLGKCATPTIGYADGKVVFACDTEGVTVKSSIKENVTGDYRDMEVAFIPTYTITAYATKKQYEDSDVATLTLCWIPCTEEHESEETGILTIPSKPVLISTQGGTITVSGLAAGTAVAAYSIASTQLATATATDGTATLATGLDAGNIAIVKIGEHSIKIVIK